MTKGASSRTGEYERVVLAASESGEMLAQGIVDQVREDDVALASIRLGRTEEIAAAGQLGERASDADGACLQIEIGSTQSNLLTSSQAGENCEQDQSAVPMIGGIRERGHLAQREDAPFRGAFLARAFEAAGIPANQTVVNGMFMIAFSSGIVALVFRCRITGGKLATNGEVSAFRWATADEVRVLASEAYAIRILDALDASGTAVRQHDGVRLV